MNIAIVTLCDESYVRGREVMFRSMKDNITNPEGHELSFLSIEPTEEFNRFNFMNFKNKATKLSLTTFSIFRDFEEYDRVVYVDSDMLVLQNIDLLLSEALNRLPFWCVHDLGCSHYYKDTLNILSDEIINGGLQIINKPLLNKEFFNKFINHIKVGDAFDGSNQGYLSKGLPELGVEIGWLPLEYNYAFQDGYYPQGLDPVIIHFTGTKPWKIESEHPYFVKWREYSGRI